MLRIGFFVWRAGLAIKYGIPAVLVLWLIFHAQGSSPLFWVTAMVFGCIGLGLGLGVGELRDREFGKTGRERAR